MRAYYFYDIRNRFNCFKEKTTILFSCLFRLGERRYHLAGALGCELLNQFFNLGWLLRVPSIRAIKVTEKGKIGFKEVFHLDL